MKSLMYGMLVIIVALTLVSCAGQTSIQQEKMMAKADLLPESVMIQSRKDAKETETWKKFDQSGLVKFLQVEDTAPASEAGAAAILDGSFGERLIEVKVDPSIEGEMVAWTLENKGPGVVWVVARSDAMMKGASLEIPVDESVNLETKLADGYSYLVVDSDGKDETTLTIKAKVGENDARTTRGKNMAVAWF